MTGTVLEISGLTVPVADNCDVDACAAAVASGNCSGWSTRTTLTSSSCATLAGGGASAFGSPLPSLQPARNQPAVKNRAIVPKPARLIGLPHVLLPDSVGLSRSYRKQPNSGS